MSVASTRPRDRGNTEGDAAFARCIRALTEGAPIRVWSLVITVMGDNAQDGFTEIGAAALAGVLGPAGVAPEAMRVALHRLKRDGWIDSRRVGRSSAYRLTPRGGDEVRRVSSRIYARHGRPAGDWHVTVGGEWSPDDGVALLPGVSLRAGRPGPSRDALDLVAGGPVPAWVADKVCPKELLAVFQRLQAALSDTARASEDLSGLTPLRATTLRMLVVHAWRRALLRAPDLPDELFPVDWPGSECRVMVALLLARFPRHDPETLLEATGRARRSDNG